MHREGDAGLLAKGHTTGRPKLKDTEGKSTPADRARAAKSHAKNREKQNQRMSERKRENSRYRVHTSQGKNPEIATAVKSGHLSVLKAGQIADPTFITVRRGHKREKEKLTSRCTDPIAADPTPIPHRTKRDAAMLEAIAKMYGEKATYEQIADAIMREFDLSEGAPE